MYNSHSRQTFTLVELLVVMGVIALLAAMLMPALAKAKEKAGKAKCVNSLHQIGVALQTYAGDFDEHMTHFQWALPAGSDFPYTHRHTRKLNLALLWPDYIDVGEFLHCPKSATYKYEDKGVWRFPASDNSDDVCFSYAFRSRYRNLRTTGEMRAIVADYFLWGRNRPHRENREGLWNHANGYNVLFNDGHAAWINDPHLDGVWQVIGPSNVSTWYGSDDGPWEYIDSRGGGG